MIKKIIVSICVLVSISTFAQRGTSSAYSFYGIGDKKFEGTSENRSMGSLSIFPDSTHVNLLNPAGYGGLKLTTFSVAGSFNSTKSISNFDEGKSQNTSVDYLTVGIPLSPKWSAGIGLLADSSTFTLIVLLSFLLSLTVIISPGFTFLINSLSISSIQCNASSAGSDEFKYLAGIITSVSILSLYLKTVPFAFFIFSPKNYFIVLFVGEDIVPVIALCAATAGLAR